MASYAKVENVVFEDDGNHFSNQLKMFDVEGSGHYFLNRAAFIKGRLIRFVSVTVGKKTLLSKTKREKIYTENDNIDEMPERVIVRTDDIEFIRKLFMIGKRVSWYDPSWDEYIATFLKFDFDRLFIDPFKYPGKIILPTAEVVYEGQDIGQYNLAVKFGYKKRSVRISNKIGFRYKFLLETLDKHSFYSFFLKRGYKYPPRKAILPNNQFIAYFNILSITYMLCQKSIVKTVRK